jgi:carboxyl-terminal processing protease
MTFTPPVSWPTKSSPKKVVPATLVVIFIVVALVIGFVAGQESISKYSPTGGYITNTNQPLPPYLGKDVDFSLFWNLWERIHTQYLEQPIVDTKLFYGALEGMVAGLGDPYSVFMDPDTAKKFDNELQGNFEGIGAEIGLKDNSLTVIAPLSGTPSEKAGLKPGDKILAIDKVDTAGMSVDHAVTLIRGPRGTKVNLFILSQGEQESRRVEITRARIEIPLVRGELKDLPSGKDKVAYIKLVHFASDTDKIFRSTLVDLIAKGPKGLILDLRNNPGGYLDQAIAISSHWIAKGVIVKEQLIPPNFKEHMSIGGGELSGTPTIILVNQGSASASEIVAGALQDLKLATIVGEQTFGKGSVQNLEELPDGSAVKLTVAKWFTPQGRSIDKNGIKPDIEIKFSKEDLEKGLDPQLDRALELLNK